MRDQFQIPEGLIYLNSGTLSYSPKTVIDAVRKAKDNLEANPAQEFINAWEHIGTAQVALAKFLSANPHDLFFRHNVTNAMNDFLMAVQIPKGSEILISNLEYGAIVNICRRKAELEGHTIKIMDLPQRGIELAQLNEEDVLELFEELITPKTKLAMFSHVTTSSGFVFPIEKMAEICREKGVLFAVDGAHGFGTQQLNFSKTKMDFYGSNLHKWFLGPKGTGFGWINPDVREKLNPLFAGWTTYETPVPFNEFNKSFASSDRFTDRWMLCSTVNFSDFQGILPTVQFWNETGVEKIMSRQKQLKNYLAKQVEKATRWKPLSSFDPRLQGPMIAFDLPEKLQSMEFELVSFLKRTHNIQVVATYIHDRWCLRMAPHIYNTQAELDTAAERLSSL